MTGGHDSGWQAQRRNFIRVRQVQRNPFHDDRAIEIGEAVCHGFIVDRRIE